MRTQMRRPRRRHVDEDTVRDTDSDALLGGGILALAHGDGPIGDTTTTSDCLTNNSPLCAQGWGHCQTAAGSSGEGK